MEKYNVSVIIDIRKLKEINVSAMHELTKPKKKTAVHDEHPSLREKQVKVIKLPLYM